MDPKKKQIVLIAVLVIIAGVAAFVWMSGSGGQTADPATIDAARAIATEGNDPNAQAAPASPDAPRPPGSARKAFTPD